MTSWPSSQAKRGISFGAIALAVLAAACSNKGASDGGGDGGLADICNSQSDAQSDTACQLQNGKQATYYIDHQGKTLWLGFTLPSQLTSTSLLSIQAGYDPKIGTPVQLAIDVVTAAGSAIVPRVADDHGASAPKELQILNQLPSSVAGQMIFILCSDDTGQHFDAKHPFFITASVVTDTDPNQAGVPTPVNLAAGSGGVQTNAPGNPGVLSTPGRVDEYSITIPGGITRPILYFSITVPSEAADGGLLSPPINYLMGYQLYDCASQTAHACAGSGSPPVPTGNLVTQDHMPNQLLAVNLDSARLVNSGDTYLLEVAGWQDPSNSTPVQGDLRAQYQLLVSVLSDSDPYDDPANPYQVSGLSLNGGPLTLSGGRLVHQAQVDLFAVPITASGNNSRIHYTFTPSPPGTVGRFPALSEFNPVRTADFFVPVPPTTGSAPYANCEQDCNTCPSDCANLTGTAPCLVNAYCEADGGPFCVYSYRQEDPADYSNLQNFEGIIPVKAGTSQIYLSYQDQGGKWADDAPYTLTLDWKDEGSENQGAYHMSETSALSGGTLTADVPASGSFPAPHAGATPLQGLLSVGNTLTSGNVATVHGVNDYDAIPSTLDVWQLSLPSVPGAATLGETWELQWQVQDSNGGSPPMELAVTPMFCSGGTCSSPQTQDPFDGLQQLIYQQGIISTWYRGYAVTWDQSTTLNPGYTTDTVQAGACYCFQPSYASDGTFYLFVQGFDRQSYADAKYTLTTAVTTYPQATPDGGSCPWTGGGIPDGGSTPNVEGCRMAAPSCGNTGDSCVANAQCCSQSCNLLGGQGSTGGFPTQGACN